ncbi:Plasmodium vivax Vir protein, putative [Plasmodium vivax]|nr:Plasmodium vivax Vir protein, putative [Plasmodium vivax]
MALFYLKNYDKSNKSESLTCNRCKLFNYWILDHLNKTFKDNYNLAFNWLYFVVNTVRDNSEVIRENNCELDFQISSDVKWKVKKEFYEYLIDYFQINTRAKLDHENCQKYQNYLQNNSLLNTYIEDILPEVEKKDLSKIYGKCQKVNQESLLSKLQNNTDYLIYDDSEDDKEKKVHGSSQC